MNKFYEVLTIIKDFKDDIELGLEEDDVIHVSKKDIERLDKVEKFIKEIVYN